MLTQTGEAIYQLDATDQRDTAVDAQLVKKITAAYSKMADDVTRTAGLERKLQLCIGAQVMLKRNKNIEAGLVNGSVGTIVGFKTETSSTDFSSGQPVINSTR